VPPAIARAQKITFAEFRASGVRGILVYCSDYPCSHHIAISGDRGPIGFGCLMLSPSSFAQLAGNRGRRYPARL
jgi:hypothetical protein